MVGERHGCGWMKYIYALNQKQKHGWSARTDGQLWFYLGHFDVIVSCL